MSTSLSNRVFRTVSTARRTAWLFALGVVLCAGVAPIRAATKVAVIDGAGGEAWCNIAISNGYECTLFPESGPTGPLDPFQIIVDLSSVWSDPDDLLAEQMRSRKSIITWGDAPQALQLINKPLVQAWMGADGHAGGGDRLLTTAIDPILSGYPIGSEIANASDAGGAALGGTESHPEAKVLARWQNGNFVGLLRNTWEGGQSVYLTNWLHPQGNPDIVANLVRVLSNPIPTVTTWGVFSMVLILLIGGSLLLYHRARSDVQIAIQKHGLHRWVRLFILALVPTGSVRGQEGDNTGLTILRQEQVMILSLGTADPFHTTQNEVTNARVVDIPGSTTRLVLWEERAAETAPAPFYAIALDGVSVDLMTDTSYDLFLRFAKFDPSISSQAVDPALASGSDTNLYIVQFWTQPLDEFQHAIETLGGDIFHYIPKHAVLARMSAPIRDQIEALPFVRWVGSFHPAFRLDQALAAELKSSGASMPDRLYTITVLANTRDVKNLVAERVSEVGGHVDFVDPAAPFLYATLTSDQLRQMVRMDEVVFVGIRTEAETDMNFVRDVSGANHIEGTGGYSGEGVRGEVMDEGLCTNPGSQCCILPGHTCTQANYCSAHSDFTPAPSLHGLYYQHKCDHGTPVFGILFGDGGGDSTARGLLPDGVGFFASNKPFAMPVSASRSVHTAELTRAPWFAVFQSNSWGHVDGWDYNAESKEMDQIIFKLDILICQSMANYGIGGGARPQAWAKNILSVGGIRTFNEADHKHHEYCESILDCCNVTQPPFGCSGDTCPICPTPPASCQSICSNRCPSCNNNYCASRGPAPAGRVKPDLTHFADCVRTASYVGPPFYDNFLGTSAATPITCGYAGLVFQMWHEGVFNVWNGMTSVPTGGGASVFDDRPHATTVKAMLINTAYRYPLVTEPPHYRPNFTRDNMGWGMVDVAALYEQRNNMFIVNETDLLKNLKTKTYTYNVPSGSPALRVTMVYADPPGIENSTDNLVNDVSVKVTSPSGAVYWGNWGLVDCLGCADHYDIPYVGNWSLVDPDPVLPKKDHVNNVENVFVKDPQPGNWTITVIADAVIQDGHVETGGKDVDYALVVSSGDRPRGRCCDTVCGPPPGYAYSCECSWTPRSECTGPGAVWTSDATCADDCTNICFNTCPQ